MKQYVDGFVIPIKKKNVKGYQKLAKLGCKIWMEYGALSYYECVGEEIKVPWGLPFPRLCKLKKDETVIFAYIVYKSKAHRNKVNDKVMKDPRMKMDPNFMPFNVKRMSMGGFEVIVRSK